MRNLCCPDGRLSEYPTQTLVTPFSIQLTKLIMFELFGVLLKKNKIKGRIVVV